MEKQHLQQHDRIEHSSTANSGFKYAGVRNLLTLRIHPKEFFNFSSGKSELLTQRNFLMPSNAQSSHKDRVIFFIENCRLINFFIP